MRKSLVVLGMFAVNQIIAQNYVHIPDSVFASYLQAVIPNAMYGDSLDITDSLVTSETDSIDISGLPVSNLEGIQYFSSLDYINSYFCELTNIPSLPSSLKHLECGRNYLPSLPILPDSLTHLFCGSNLITELPLLPPKLYYLSCSDNPLTTLPTLPNSVAAIKCNNISSLTQLPDLPDSLQLLWCFYNSLTSLPQLPNTITSLMCNNNYLTALPYLPDSLNDLRCQTNLLTTLPPLPNSLRTIWCQGNSLNSLPLLPDSLEKLHCNVNNISCFPPFPESILPAQYHSGSGYWEYHIDIALNPFTCLPNYLPGAMNQATLAYPLCTPEPVPVIEVNGTTLTCITVGVSYQWFYNGNYISGATTTVLYNATECGNYTVTVGDVNGCLGVSEPVYCPTDINEETKNEILVFPNPATTEITVQWAGNSTQSEVTIYNTQGQLVLHSTFDVRNSTPDSYRVDISSFPSGLYLLQLFDAKGALVKTEKVVKE